MTIEKPFFMSNDEWFYFDEDKMQYFLTEKATQTAKKGYEEFYASVFGGKAE